MDYSIAQLDQEFTNILINSGSWRQRQRDYIKYYNNNVFYAPKAGDPKLLRNVGVNLLRLFADKNIHFLAGFPTIKKTGGVQPDVRRQAQLNEKVILSTWDNNNGKLLQRRWVSDGTLMAEAYSLLDWDMDDRQPTIKRLDPRYCHTKFTNEVDGEIEAFWYAVPMTKEAVKAKFGIDPQQSGIGSAAVTLDGNNVPVDGRDRYYVVIRWDKDTKVAWVGNKYIEQPHKHLWPFIPIDVARPFDANDTTGRGGFFIEQLVGLQAEFNETLRRRANIIKKLSNPAVWGRGIVANQFDEIKAALEGAGGFVGLKAQGELGFLQLQETAVLDNHLNDLFEKMKLISGFTDASLGMRLGANTSAAAVAMYFAPTQKALESQWMSYGRMYESINEKIIRAYQIFGRTGEQFKLYGSRPRGTYELVDGDDGESTKQFMSGSYQIQFTKDQLGDDYCTEVVMPEITPQDKTTQRQLAVQTVTQGFFPRLRAYELFGDLDPEETLDLLAQEREDPRVHPEVLQQVSQAMSQLGGGQPTGQEPLPAENATPGVQPPANDMEQMMSAAGGRYVG